MGARGRRQELLTKFAVGWSRLRSRKSLMERRKKSKSSYSYFKMRYWFGLIANSLGSIPGRTVKKGRREVLCIAGSC